ncbi:MAG: hypothetical protein ACI9R3_005951 [Verrucomicrobiales bacterium]|jgi:hypothetical protein
MHKLSGSKCLDSLPPPLNMPKMKTVLTWIYNVFATAVLLAMAKFGVENSGPESYGSALGNLKIAGYLFAAFFGGGILVSAGQTLFRVKEGESTNKAFFMTLSAILLVFISILIFLVRSLLLWMGWLEAGAEPPGWLEWMFYSIEWLMQNA